MALAVGLTLAASGICLFPACGPQPYRPVAQTDGHVDLPGTGGTLGGTGGRIAGGTGGSAPVDGGFCSVRDASASDAAPGAFNMSWSFDDANGLQGWAHVGQPSDVRDATVQRFDPDGYPAAGSARVIVPFNGGAQQIAFGYNFSTPQDLSHQVLSARVRLNSCNGSGSVVVGMAYKSVAGVYEYAASNPVDITAASGWITLTMSIDNPGGYVDMSHRDADGGVILPDPSATLEIDVIIQSNQGPYLGADVSVDTVGLSNEGAAGPDAAPNDGIDGAGPDGSDAPDATTDVRDAPGAGS